MFMLIILNFRLFQFDKVKSITGKIGLSYFGYNQELIRVIGKGCSVLFAGCTLFSDDQPNQERLCKVWVQLNLR